jgi:hypothetical protein
MPRCPETSRVIRLTKAYVAHGSAAVQEVSAQRRPMKQQEAPEALAGL